MKRLISLASLMLITLAVTAGCNKKATSTTTETIKGPGGTTTVEQKETVKKSGENPPAP